MFDGFKSILGAVGQKIDVIKEKSTQSLESIKQDSNKVVSSVNKNLLDLAAVSKESIGTFGGKILPFGSGIDDRVGHHKEVSFHAGTEIVDGYSHAFAVVKHNNLVVAEKARLTYRKLLACAKHCSSLESQWKEMNVAIQTLPELTATVSLIQERVQGLCSSISKIESALTQLNEDTVSHQISLWKAQESAKVDEYERKRTAELRDLELKMRKSREVVVDEKKQKALSRSMSIEKEAERETDRVRAQLDQQVQKSMEEYLIYGGFGSSGRKAPTEDDAHAQLKKIAPSIASNELEDFLGGDDEQQQQGAEDLVASTASDASSDSAPAVVVLQDEEPVPQ